MNPTRRIYFQKLIPGLIFGFVVFIGLSLLGDIHQVGRSFQTFNWSFFPLALGFTLFNYSLRFLKWHFYLKLIGARQIPWRRSLKMFVAGFPLAVTPGKVGEVLKGIWINRYSGIPAARGVSVVVAERISDGLAVLFLSTLGVIAYPRYWPAFLIVLVLLIFTIVISQIRPLALFIIERLEKIRLLGNAIHHLREFYEGSYMLFQPLPTFAAVMLGMISWFGEGVGFYLILIGLGLPPGATLFSSAVFILAFSTVVGAVSALPGGLGAAEASIAGMLAITGLADPARATTATVLIRLATLWFGEVLGLTAWLFSGDLLGPTNERQPSLED